MTQQDPKHAKSHLTPSQQDVQETLLETKAAQALLLKVRAEVAVQDNITLREAKELQPYISELFKAHYNVSHNEGRHSAEAMTAAKSAVDLLSKYLPKNMDDSRMVQNMIDLKETFSGPLNTPAIKHANNPSTKTGGR